MLFLFTVTEWGHVIYLEETASNAPPPPENPLTGGGQEIRGFTSSRTSWSYLGLMALCNLPMRIWTTFTSALAASSTALCETETPQSAGRLLSTVREGKLIWRDKRWDNFLFDGFIYVMTMLSVKLIKKRKTIPNSCSTVLPERGGSSNLWLQLVEIMTSA